MAERLADIAKLLPQSLAVAEVGQRIADAVFAVLECRRRLVFGLDRGSGDPVLVRLWVTRGRASARSRFPDAAGMVGLAVRSARPC